MSNNLKFVNHLANEKSPYLLQHVHNPVDWYPWGKSAFDKAQLEDKPILLSVGYSTCHWCHVMAHESFEDPTIAQLINDSFIPIKVDREERPEIDHIYMTAITAMTGQGGWPLTVFLTAQGDPFFGGTYFPPYAKWGSVGFSDLLNMIIKEWKSNRQNIISSGRSITESLSQRSELTETEVDDTLLDNAFLQMKRQYDPANGGFGGAPKFPMGHNLSFLLRYSKRRKDPEALTMAEQTLRSMSLGGIRDHLGGGFHRYSTDQHWHLPHFEKMLYDQALLSRAYVEAYQVTGLRDYEQIAREIFDYVLGTMTDKEGGFYSAEDADSLESVDGHLQEGAFYVFSQSEIIEVLGKDTALVFNYCYGVLEQGNVSLDPHGEFKGKNILYAAQSPEEAGAKFHKTIDEIQYILKGAREKLLARRNQKPRPHLDDKVLCDWNGLMMASFAFAGRVLAEPKYTQAAVRSADFILNHMMLSARLLHRWRQGEAGIMATLEDYAFFIYGLLDVYEATFQDKYLARACDLADVMIEFFADKQGGFYMTASDAENLILRPKEAYDGAIPSGNSVAALVLLKLYALTQKDSYRLHAEALFRCFASSVAQAPSAHSFWLSAMEWHLYSPLEITLEGRQNESTVSDMLKVLYKYFMPLKTVKYVPSLNNGKAHICYRGTCKTPIDNVNIFEQELMAL